MRIGIDARFFGPQDKGLGRYTQKLIENLEEIDGNSQRKYLIFLRKRGFESYQPRSANFQKILADYPWYSWSEQFFFPWQLYRQKLDLMHFCHFNVPILYWKKILVTIHDLILFHYPTFRNTTLHWAVYFFKLIAYRLVIYWAVWKAKIVLAVSEFTKKDILKNFPWTKGKVVAIPEGCDLPKINDFQDWKKYGIIKPYLLYVGNAYPHKNLERLCRAFQKIKAVEPKLNLVLAGGEDFFYQRLKKEIKKNHWQGIILAGFIEEIDLGKIYQEAELLVFPSLYEGVGLPPLEALASGTAVVSSWAASLPEFLGQAALYFDPKNENEMVEKILKIWNNPKKKKALIKEGKARIKNFSWQKMARETLSFYQKQEK